MKIGRSAPALPLRVTVERVELPEGFMEMINKHLLLVYTGKTRLARNLLQVSVPPHMLATVKKANLCVFLKYLDMNQGVELIFVNTIRNVFCAFCSC